MSEPRFTARSDGGLVEAEANLRGELVALRIDPDAPTSARADDLGAQVVEAAGRALREAVRIRNENLLARAAAAGLPLPPGRMR